MKKLVLSLLLAVSTLAFAQVPQGISYQAVAMNGSGAPVASSNVGLRLSILDLAANGTVLYTETHTKTTNAQGLFNLSIGQGTPVTGTLASINWGTNAKFLKVEMDVAGGTNYVLVGTTQLLSVPYSLMSGGLKMTQAGGTLTLTSPNGTQYQVGVTNAGELTLPTATNASTQPTTFYMYGSFNSFTPATALLMAGTGYYRYGYKYLTAGTQIKFITSNADNGVAYGFGPADLLVPNGNAYTVPSSGFYAISISIDDQVYASITQVTPYVQLYDNNTWTQTTVYPTFNTATNVFTFPLTGITNTYNNLQMEMASGNGGMNTYGDYLFDGTLDVGGPSIPFPNVNGTPKNYSFKVNVAFNGSATYTLTNP